MRLTKIFLALTALGIAIQGQAASEVNGLDRSMSDWLSLERQRSALQLEWQESKPLLQQRLELLAAEKNALEALLGEQRQEGSEAETERLALQRAQLDAEARQTQMRSWLDTELARARALLPMLPPPLARQWQTLLDDAKLAGDNNQRLDALLTAFGKLREFNGRIATFEEEIITPGGEPLLVRQLYLGAGQGWYLTLDGSQVMEGRAVDGVWQWQQVAEPGAAELGRIFAMAAREREAALVRVALSPLPKHPAPEPKHPVSASEPLVSAESANE
ncbi:DUF3450 family protein [Shewanella sp. JM162201]|uniref:DUF3450 family protein n=1 Tax=Shewanella jiangmenensis TaxID=2837387 RepID=A0ABS5UZX9_9GAMM|nr:DUF3450 family protein [Shewanella jiangmenensis]MBT1443781.1 DUF3450 family protein [Shewanella jiangmenensis]